MSKKGRKKKRGRKKGVKNKISDERILKEKNLKNIPIEFKDGLKLEV